jgi:hypothetical protein
MTRNDNKNPGDNTKDEKAPRCRHDRAETMTSIHGYLVKAWCPRCGAFGVLKPAHGMYKWHWCKPERRA